MEQVYIARQVKRALELLANQSNLPESNAMEIADIYEEYKVGKNYPVGYVSKYGVNADNETQLYSVLQEHTSQADWIPSETPSLYKAIGFTEDGIPVWTQPLGANDAYMLGDVVSHDGEIWVSDVDYNVWQPAVYGWHIRTEA